ncbi:MAG: hypothetical protein WBF33_03970 [Candidatus Nitrosopolaris sp.]
MSDDEIPEDLNVHKRIWERRKTSYSWRFVDFPDFIQGIYLNFIIPPHWSQQFF